MINSEIAKILREIGEYLEMQDEPFKPRAYEKVAGVIDGFSESVEEIYKKGGIAALEEIPGVGISIAEKIEELIKNGRIKYYEQLKKKTPVNLTELTAIEGLGPKSIKKLYKELKIKNLTDLEKAAKQGKIRKLESFGEKSEENILKSIEFTKRSGGRFILGFIMPEIREIEKRLRGFKEVRELEIAGSVRRRKETIGDIDILIISENPKPVMNYFVNMPEVLRVYAHGSTKSAIKLKSGIDVDLRVVPEKSYGAALNYFTGSKDHNIALREIAIKKGYKLNEYGLFQIAKQRGIMRGTARKNKEIMIAGQSEEEIYRILGMDYIEPELRENTGEIEAAINHRLPALIKYGDLKGDLQIQTNWSDGANSIEEYAREALKLGLEYILISDHTKRLAMTGGLDEKMVLKQMAEIDRINSKLNSLRQPADDGQNSKLRILKGTEVDILKDGALDLPDRILAKLDVVGAAVHSYFNLSRKDQTERIKRAMLNPNVDIIFHPTGRVIQRRESYDVDIDDIIRTAKSTKTVLEVDAFPDRLDLSDEYVRRCVEAGVKISIDSDSHSITHLHYLEFGIAEARRGWATKKDIINAWPLEKMFKTLKNV